MKARVKWFNNEKGFGFLEYKEGCDIFVHYSQIQKTGYKTLESGSIVNFDLIETDKGYQAHNVLEHVI
jgi:CspA family cold shock protein